MQFSNITERASNLPPDAKILSIVDYHVAGCPVRILADGLPLLQSTAVAEKMQEMKTRHDWIRKQLLWEPWGKSSLVAAILAEPVTKEAAASVFFLGSDDYAGFCGSAAMAVGRFLMESGCVRVPENGKQKIILDTAFGQMPLYIEVHNGGIDSVSFVKKEAHVSLDMREAEIPGAGKVSWRIGNGGNYFAMVSEDVVEGGICLENLPQYRTLAVKMLGWFADHGKIKNPITGEKERISEIMFGGKRRDTYGTEIFTSIIVYGNGIVDHSPCGSGTCARILSETLCLEQALGKDFVHESVYGTQYRGKILCSRVEKGWKIADCIVTGNPRKTGSGILIAEKGDSLEPYQQTVE